jgi:hypothetical protein
MNCAGETKMFVDSHVNGAPNVSVTLEPGLQIQPILSNFGEMWRIRPPPMSKKIGIVYKKNQYYS